MQYINFQKLAGSILPCCAILSLLASESAQAQTAEPSPSDTAARPDQRGSTELEDIVVTAQKRRESIQSVPITMSALTSDSIKANQIAGTEALQALVPGLVTSRQGSNAVNYLRGVGQNDGTFGQESQLATYLDGVYLWSPAASIFSLNNIERIEVLKGPQGTLFGRNSTAGVIHVVTREPDSEASGSAEIGYANDDTKSARLYATTGISGNLASNLSVYFQDRNKGYVRNLTDNSRIYRSRDLALQNKWRLSVGDDSEVLLNLFYNNHKGTDVFAAGFFPGVLRFDGAPGYISEWALYAPRRPRLDQTQAMASLRLTRDFDWGSVMSLSAYHRFVQHADYSQSGLPPPAIGAILAHADIRESTFSQEFQIQAPRGNAIQWIVGLFYLRDTGQPHTTVYALGASDVPSPLIHFDARLTTESGAIFAQATTAILHNTRLTLGGRLTRDVIKLAGEFYSGGSQPFGSPDYVPGVFVRTPGTNQPNPFEPKLKSTKPTWRLAIDHDLTDDVMIFATYNRGYKSGTFNTADFTNPPTKPESLDAFEIGFKGDFLDRHLRFNLSAFHYNYRNMQLHAVGPTPPTQVTYNAGHARIQGIDVDFVAAISERLRVTGGIEYMPTAKYIELKRGTQTYANPYPFGFVNGVPVVPPGCIGPVTGATSLPGGVASLGCDLSGNRLVRAPKLSGNVGIQYILRLNGGSQLTTHVTDSFNSGYGFLDDGAVKQKPYHNLRASIAWKDPSGRFDVRIWGTNLTKRVIHSAAFGGARGYAYFPGEPRFYGVTLGAAF